MFVPPQGFRHAAVLLLTGRARKIPADASGESVAAELARLAEDLVALADDMRAPAESVDWIRAEYARIVGQMPQDFDRGAVTSAADTLIGRVAARAPVVEARDLFLVYVPEDRLPLAAPLAVELAKRRVSVALAEYEVATSEQLAAALQVGLTHHRAGAILSTPAFARLKIGLTPFARVRVLDEIGPHTADTLADWVRQIKTGNVAD